MRFISFLLCALAASAAGQVLQPVAPPINPLLEYRQCGEPARDAKGTIIRRADVLYAYRKAHPCPVTGKTTGACPGWSMDHIVPLAKGGCDMVSNLAWMPNSIKSCAAPNCIDRWERTYYGNPHGIVVLP
jgi:hypothetical protein